MVGRRYRRLLRAEAAAPAPSTPNGANLARGHCGSCTPSAPSEVSLANAAGRERDGGNSDGGHSARCLPAALCCQTWCGSHQGFLQVVVRPTAREWRTFRAREGGAAEGAAAESTMYGEFLRIVLEIINCALAAGQGPASNPQLVYSLLHRQDVFAAFRGQADLQELLGNVFLVLDFFNARVRRPPPPPTRVPTPKLRHETSPGRSVATHQMHQVSVSPAGVPSSDQQCKLVACSGVPATQLQNHPPPTTHPSGLPSERRWSTGSLSPETGPRPPSQHWQSWGCGIAMVCPLCLGEAVPPGAGAGAGSAARLRITFVPIRATYGFVPSDEQP